MGSSQSKAPAPATAFERSIATMETNNNNSDRSEHIANLISFAHTTYEENPTEALSSLMQALTLNNGQGSADIAMNRLRNELGEDVMDPIGNRKGRVERAFAIVNEMLQDESTFLYQRGKQDILRQAMEDGSSVVCTKCNAMVSAVRWQQHQAYWCQSIETEMMDDEQQETNTH